MEGTDSSSGFGDFSATLRRRWRHMFAVGVPIAAASILLGVFAPTRYESTAVFAVEEARLAEMGGTSSTQRDNYVDQYIKDLQGIVLSSNSFRQMLAAQKRLPENDADRSNLAEQLRKQVKLRVISEQVLDPQTGRERTIISEFELRGQDNSPELAQGMVEWLSERFIEGDRSMRLQRSQSYSRFLNDEEIKRKQRVDDLDKQLADFKQRNIGQLPESSQLNMDFKERAERDLQESEAQLRTLVRERSFAQQQLQQQASAPSSRLQELQSLYNDRLQTYDASHPDMLSLQREIDQLRAGNGRRGGSLRDQLNSQREILAQAKQRYSDDHPDVTRLQRAIAALEARIAAGETSDQSAAPVSANELQLRTQINSLDLQIASLQSQADAFRARIATVRNQIQSSPQVEREYQALSQDLTLARTAYQDAVQRKMNADIAASAITSGSADVFRLAQRASIPEGKVKTRSVAIVAVGLFIAASLAFAAALVSEIFDPTVRGSRDVRQVLGVTPLAIIPVITNSASKSMHRAGQFRLAASVLLTTVALFAVGYTLAL